MLVDMRTLNSLMGLKNRRKAVPGTARKMLGRLEGLLGDESSIKLLKRLREEGYD